MLNLILVLFYTTSLCHCLRWTKTGYKVTTDTVISMMNAKSMPEIDISTGVQVTIIRNTNNFEKGIKIYCYVAGYSDKPLAFSFCKYGSTCIQIAEGPNTRNNAYNFDATFNTSIPVKKGVEIWLKLNEKKNDYSGGYFCKAKNDVFEILSNNIEIRDKIYWGPNLFLDIVKEVKSNIKIIKQSNMPHILNCSDGLSKINPAAPKWTNIEYINPVQWSVCPVFNSAEALNARAQMTLNKCLQFSKDKCDDTLDGELCPLELSKMADWSTYVNQKGDLIFTDIRPVTNNRISSYALMCYADYKSDGNKALFYFLDTYAEEQILKGISFDGTATSITKPLTPISPKVQHFDLYARKIPTEMQTISIKPVAIYAFYKASSEATSKWKLGGVELNSNNIMKVSRFMITFHKDVSWEQAGKYTLEVTDKSELLTMEVNVKVLGPPILVDDQCLDPLLYIWQGNSAAFTCTYKQYPTTKKLLVNGQEIKLGDSLDNSKANLKKSYPYLEMLNFTLQSSILLNDDVSVTYNVFNLTKSLGQSQYQDHTITFLASNDFGYIVKTSSIYVVPRLIDIVTYFPERDNCTTPCSSAEIHKFKCEVKVEEYENKELLVEYYWTINAHRLGDQGGHGKNMFTAYFEVDPVTKVLTMLPIKSNNTDNDKAVRQALTNNFIECNVDIKSANKDESTFRYVSTTDGSLGISMKAKITLDNVPINSAYIYWIMAIILGILILIILIVLLTRYCMRNKGETYPLDKLEREHGYDPEKEVQEELFKPYERQEQDPEVMTSIESERRLSVTGNSVGSYDDGELDTYDLDPSNFNEDGSIIGKYGANPRSRAVVS